MELEEFEVYKKAVRIGEEVWEVVKDWSYFQKDTLGKQMTRSADSIAANIAEGYGRFFYKENRQFCYYARGSMDETICWIHKCENRGLVSHEQAVRLLENLKSCRQLLNGYIRSIGRTPTPDP